MQVAKLDKLVWREMIGPWLFGVAMFTVVLMAGTYLFRLTDFLVKGVDPGDVIMLSLLYMPGLIAKTFPMAVLLGSLLAFGRLSNDLEIIAAQAGGASIYRIMRPVALFGVMVSVIAFAFGEFIVPSASLKATQLQTGVIRKLKQDAPQPYSQTLFVRSEFRGHLSARDLNVAGNVMRDVTVVWWGKDPQPSAFFFVKELFYVPGQQWFAKGGYVIRQEPSGTLSRFTFEDARPPFGEALDFTPYSLISSRITDYDALSLGQMKSRIAGLRQNPQKDTETIRKIRDLEVGYWTKWSLPLSGIVFALVGAPVSIRRVRQSVGVGVGISILMIFGYYLLHNYMTILAKGGKVHPAISAFFPVAIGVVAAAVLLSRKNS
jgi:lipopolysaccharide export system permease protein